MCKEGSMVLGSVKEDLKIKLFTDAAERNEATSPVIKVLISNYHQNKIHLNIIIVK